ncbi:hypothetical protein [Aminobacter sp. SS-2016]|uniref:hypothetical protein n=1 Tax=Aminobacter sp. Y103A TaxID=1870862 RepID=UPI00257484BB|nr:hypothetical protein [Aminobacter sp. SS-2016]
MPTMGVLRRDRDIRCSCSGLPALPGNLKSKRPPKQPPIDALRHVENSMPYRVTRRNPVLIDGEIRWSLTPSCNVASPEGKTALHQLPLLPRRAGFALLRRGLFKGADVAEAKGAAILMAIWVLLGVLPVLAQMP